jgi:hypothetical protein
MPPRFSETTLLSGVFSGRRRFSRRAAAGPPWERRRIHAGNPVTTATMGGPAGGRQK